MDHLLSPVSSFAQIPWAKLVYSALLLFVAGVLINEVVRVWGTSQVYIGDFKYFVDGKDDGARAQTMRALILHHNRALADGFSRELQRRRQLQAAADAQPQDADHVWLPTGGVPITDSASAFANVELTVQGINFTQIMTALRRTISPPNEITGFIGRTGDRLSAMVQWPRAPERSDGLLAPAGTIPVEGARDDAELAFDIACSLIWTEAVAQTTSKLVGVDRVTFCAFARAWSDMAAIRARRAKHLALTNADVATLTLARSIVSGIIDKKIGFPEAHRLRADIVALLPELNEEDKAQRVADLAAAEGEIAPAPSSGLEAQVLGNSRPALGLTSTHLTVPETGIWSAYLKAHIVQITAAAAAVGYLRGGKDPQLPYFGTGFVIGPDLVATANYAISGATDGNVQALTGPAVEFVVADAIGAATSAAFTVTEIVAIVPAAANPPHRMAVLRVPGLAAAGHKPLKISVGAAPGPGLRIGVIGYPAFDARTPATVLQAVFKNTFGQKRLMVGKLTDKPEAYSDRNDLFHDAATIGGVGGGPILNLETGEVVGIHLGGSFVGNSKSNFGMSMATALPQPARAQLGL